jgi:hypothetical protein
MYKLSLTLLLIISIFTLLPFSSIGDVKAAGSSAATAADCSTLSNPADIPLCNTCFSNGDYWVSARCVSDEDICASMGGAPSGVNGRCELVAEESECYELGTTYGFSRGPFPSVGGTTQGDHAGSNHPRLAPGVPFCGIFYDDLIKMAVAQGKTIRSGSANCYEYDGATGTRLPADENALSCVQCIDGGGLWVAIGCVDPTPLGVITGLIRIAFGVMGGVALIQLIKAGIMYQKGDEAGIQKARGQVIIALLVFSVLALRIIGVNILDVLPEGSV